MHADVPCEIERGESRYNARTEEGKDAELNTELDRVESYNDVPKKLAYTTEVEEATIAKEMIGTKWHQDLGG